MFLTTIRVRRARMQTLDHALTTAQLQNYKDRRGDLVEVMAHGQPVAVLDSSDFSAEPLWVHPDLTAHYSERKLAQLLRDAVALMDAVKAAGLAEHGERAAA